MHIWVSERPISSLASFFSVICWNLNERKMWRLNKPTETFLSYIRKLKIPKFVVQLMLFKNTKTLETSQKSFKKFKFWKFGDFSLKFKKTKNTGIWSVIRAFKNVKISQIPQKYPKKFKHQSFGVISKRSLTQKFGANLVLS